MHIWLSNCKRCSSLHQQSVQSDHNKESHPKSDCMCQLGSTSVIEGSTLTNLIKYSETWIIWQFSETQRRIWSQFLHKNDSRPVFLLLLWHCNMLSRVRGEKYQDQGWVWWMCFGIMPRSKGGSLKSLSSSSSACSPLGGRQRPCWWHCDGHPGWKNPGDAWHNHHSKT